MQIRSRLTLQFSFLVGSILLIAFVSIYFFYKQRVDDSFRQRLTDKAVTSAILLLKIEEVDSALLKTIDLSKPDILEGENISIFDETDKEIYTNNDTLNFRPIHPMLRQIRSSGTQQFKQEPFTIVGIPFQDKDKKYIIIAGAIDREGQTRLAELSKLLISLFLIMIAMVAASGWFYAGRALRPIKKVMINVQEISTNDLSRRLSGADATDEIGKLTAMFNSLLGRIENAFSLQKTFVANVSHELKNPLTKITSQLEVTLLQDREPSEYRAILKSVLEDIHELNQMSTSLLDLASINQDHVSFTMTQVRIDETLWEVREKIQALDPEYRVNIHTIAMPSDEDGLYMAANPYLLKTALQNLIENACKFSNDHIATISLICSAKELEIRIFDNGPGIHKKELQNIFQPFYRSDSTSKIKGHGIGLSLSQRIITIHQGTLEIDSNVGEGTQVTVVFPTIHS